MSVFYQSLCFNISKNWDNQLNATIPDFPRCFQYFDCSLYLLLYSLCCVLYVIWLYAQKVNWRPILKLFVAKIVLIAALIVSQLAELIFNLANLSDQSIAFTLSNVFFTASLIIMLLVLHLERRVNAINSGFYFNFWVLLCLIYFVRVRSFAFAFGLEEMPAAMVTRAAFVFVDSGMVVVSLVLSCVSDRVVMLGKEKGGLAVGVGVNMEMKSEPGLLPEEELVAGHKGVAEESDQDPPLKECPENYASFLNRLCFLWFSSMVWLGYKRPLTQKDLWNLNEEDSCRSVVPPFLANLQRYLHNTPVPVTGSTNNSNRANLEQMYQEKRENNGDSENPNKAPGVDEKLLPPSEEDKKQQKQQTTAKDKFDPCLMLALLRSHWVALLVSGFYKLIQDSMNFLGPMLLKLLLDFVSSKNQPLWVGYSLAGLLLASALIKSLILHQYFHIVFRIGMRIRTSLIVAVYRKSLVLSMWSRKESTVGEIVNLMSVDSQKFLELLSYLHMIWSAPLQIIVCLILLWVELGPSVLGGLLIMLLLIPINALIGNLTRKYQTSQLKYSDSRIKLMNEILNGIKVLKLYAWENSFMKFVTDIRDDELKFMKKSAYLNAVIGFTFSCAPFLVSLTTFGIYVLVSPDNILDAKKVFVSISLFNILRFPIMMLPMVIASLIQAQVSLKRLTVFLKRNEIDADAVQHTTDSTIAVSVDGADFAWDPQSSQPFLYSIQLSVSPSQFIAIVGPVGSGKSSVLSAVLGDMHLCNPNPIPATNDYQQQQQISRVRVSGRVAYVPQQAWIVNVSLRDNILFGQPFDACRYHRVLQACSLERDLEILPQGDMTEIGEKGINLSGGQKQRVSLARACYSEADVVLLDDPLSAVDSHVASHLIEHVFSSSGGILAGRTRILVTHNLAVLPSCDRVVVMEAGRITEQGSYSDLVHHAGPFAHFVAHHQAGTKEQNASTLGTDGAMDESEMQVLEDLAAGPAGQDSAIRAAISKSRDSIHSMASSKPTEGDAGSSPRKRDSQQCRDRLALMGAHGGDKYDKLIEEETANVGNVQLAVYMSYIRSVGLLLVAAILLLFVVTQSMSLGANLWLVRWSSQADKSANHSAVLASMMANPQPRSTEMESEIENLRVFLAKERDLNLGIYGMFGLAQGVFQLVCSVTFAIGYIRAACGLHEQLLVGILHSPMSLFETVPLGRLLNRFSVDIAAVGLMLPQSINGLLLTIMSAAVVMIMVVLPNPWILVPLLFIVFAYVFMQRFYVATSRQLKRLESVSKSPIYSHFGETLQGVSSIRAYSLNERFIRASEIKVDRNLYAYYANIASNRWLAVILETIGNMIVFVAALFSVASLQFGLEISAGLVGLSVSYALGITQTLNWLVRMSSEVETNIVAVERIEEYCNITPEAPWVVEDNKPPDDWPSEGVIEFCDYSTRYREGLDLVLHGVSVRVEAKQKVGIVGRTGSGKSSLVLALFRVLERAGGEIRIDGRAIHELGLHDLRGRLTIIPQDPVLFSGSLRNNIDPFSAHSDDELWAVLESSNLAAFVRAQVVAPSVTAIDDKDKDKGDKDKGDKEQGVVKTNQLDMHISEGGENLSVGQRQLICLARALLRRSKILVLDEATAAVDLDTDALIQDTIRDQFRNCTILTIAHRLKTVLDYDRILVLDNGKVVELDSPENLLQNKESAFYSMAKDAKLV